MRGLGKRGYTRWGIWFIFFNFMPPLPLMLTYTSPVDLWIIRKTNSDHVWAEELAHWSFTYAKNRFLWLFLKIEITVFGIFLTKSRKGKKNTSWVNVKFFCFPFYLNCIIVHLGLLVCFTVWPTVAWCYPTIVNVRTFLKMGKIKLCSSQTGLLYMDKNFFHCGLNTFI